MFISITKENLLGASCGTIASHVKRREAEDQFAHFHLMWIGFCGDIKIQTIMVVPEVFYLSLYKFE